MTTSIEVLTPKPEIVCYEAHRPKIEVEAIICAMSLFDPLVMNDYLKIKSLIREAYNRGLRNIAMVVSIRGGYDIVFGLPMIRCVIDELREGGGKFITIADGNCLSAGASLLMLGHPDGVYASRSAIIRFHGTKHPINKLDLFTERLLRTFDKSALHAFQGSLLQEILMLRTGLDSNGVNAFYFGNTPFNQDEAMQLHLIDGIVSFETMLQ